MKRLAYIDSLRGLAAVGVVATHTAHLVPGMPWRAYALAGTGATGVQLFFVLSALTLLLSWHERQEDALQFYIRRVCRIAPMFWLAAIFYSCLHPLWPQFWQTGDAGLNSFVLTLLFQHGWSPDSINSVVPGGWSIAVEMTFYAAFPLLAAFVTDARRAICFLALALAVAAAANSLVLQHATPGPDLNRFLYYWLPNSLPCFAVGFLAYFLVTADLARYRHSGLCLGTAMLILVWLAWSGVPYASTVSAPISRGTVAALAGVLLVLAGASGGIPRPVGYVLGKLGQWSFSLYLVHWLIIETMIQTIGIRPASGFAAIGWYLLLLVAAVGLSAGLASLTYWYIEKPGIRLGARLAAARPRVGVAP